MMTMKYTLYILAFTSGFWSCNNRASEKSMNQKTVDTLAITSFEKEQKAIFVKDESLYDKTFINGLSEFGEQIWLIDNYIVTNTDTTYFPEDLPLNKRISYTAVDENNKFMLRLTRNNMTNVHFQFQIFDIADNIIDTKTGTVILGSGFFLGTEGEHDPETGVSFISNEYRTNNDEFWLTIKVGIDEYNENLKRAKITYRDKDKSKNTDYVKESPILRHIE